MSCGHDNIVKLFDSVFVVDHVSITHLKLGNVFQVLNVSCHATELDELSQALSFKPFQKVSLVNLSRQIRRDWLAEILLEGKVRELKDFFRQVGPKLTVHAGMHMLTILVSSGAPCVVPLTTPVRLFVDTGDLEVSSRGQLVEGLEGGQTGRACTYDENLFRNVHLCNITLINWIG